MKIREHFTIAAQPDPVWEFLTDPKRVTKALPGTEVSERIDKMNYKGDIAMKVGPITAAYTGTVSFSFDEKSRSAVIRARGRSKRGMGNASLDMTSQLCGLPAGRTGVKVEADLAVSGILARLGRGMIRHLSRKLIRDFAKVVGRELAAGAAMRKQKRHD